MLQPCESKKCRVQSISKGHLFNEKPELAKALICDNLCLVLPISLSFCDEGELAFQHDIGCIFMKEDGCLLMFDSLGCTDALHTKKIREVLNYVKDAMFTASSFTVKESVLVVRNAWQPLNDTYCVVDVWYFFWLFASKAQDLTFDQQQLCTYYSNAVNIKNRSSILAKWYSNAISDFDFKPDLPRSPERRVNLASCVTPDVEVCQTRCPRSMESIASPDSRLWELDLDDPHADTQNPSPRWQYSPLICRRKSCLFKRKEDSHHRNMNIYICS